ncbi:hypothetical protein [Pantoea phage Nufs112]|nr:hypothetical protein [Pantoea phage Nufs112]
MKRRFRLFKISELPQGTRFWYAKGSKLSCEATLIAYSHKRGVAITHFGHEYNRSARRFRVWHWTSVWVEVKYD